MKFRKIALILISLLIGVTFIFSGYSKLFPIEPFEYTFVDIGVGNWYTSPFIARLLIAIEFFIGVFFLLNTYLNKRIFYFTQGMLAFFTIYLAVQIAINGNNGNCGCFGTMLVFTPLEAILKNIVLAVLVWVLTRFHSDVFSLQKFRLFLILFLALTSILIPFIFNPIQLSYSEAYLNANRDSSFKLELDSLYVNAKRNVPPKSLSQGKHVLTFFSLTCNHCRVAAKKLRIMKELNPSLPLYFVLNGKEDKLKFFFEDTRSQNIPHCMLPARPFIFLAGTELPSIYLVNNSVVESSLNYFELDQKEIENWLQKP
ncbi:MAG: DoxX family membrane protein [Bacteroidetes bacterium]|nr:DoxX family membrane protein [Bacteroidota bacterium]